MITEKDGHTMCVRNVVRNTGVTIITDLINQEVGRVERALFG